MIALTRLHGERIFVNAGLIEFIELTPDTLISMATGRKLMVLESADYVLEKVLAYQQAIGHPAIVPHDYEEESEDEE